MFSSPMKTLRQPAAAAFHEIRDFVAQRIDLHDDVDLEAVFLLELDDAVEDGFPVLVAGEIVVGDEKAADALRIAGAKHALDVIGGPIAGFATLHVDDAAEAAGVRAAAPGVEASSFPA